MQVKCINQSTFYVGKIVKDAEITHAGEMYPFSEMKQTIDKINVFIFNPKRNLHYESSHPGEIDTNEWQHNYKFIDFYFLAFFMGFYVSLTYFK